MRMIATMLAGIISCSTAVGQDLYSVTDLGILPGDEFSIAVGINNPGQVIGMSVDALGATRAFMTVGPTLVSLGSFGENEVIPRAINDDGLVVGFANHMGRARAFQWTAAKGMLPLGLPPGIVDSYAYAVSADGVIVGACALGSDPIPQHAMRWDVPHQPPIDLGTLLGGQNSTAYGINAGGRIVGASETGAGAVLAFLWSPVNEQMTSLGTLGGAASEARRINSAGWVVGAATTSTFDYHAFARSPISGQMIDLTPAANSSTARDVNEAAVVVGVADDFAFRWRAARNDLVLLDTLVQPAGWHILDAAGINDAGAIAATGRFNNGPQRALLLTPVTAPACQGDLNLDGQVDQADLALLLASYGASAGGDLNGDGQTDQADLALLLANYGSAC